MEIAKECILCGMTLPLAWVGDIAIVLQPLPGNLFGRKLALPFSPLAWCHPSLAAPKHAKPSCPREVGNGGAAWGALLSQCPRLAQGEGSSCGYSGIGLPLRGHM